MAPGDAKTALGAGWAAAPDGALRRETLPSMLRRLNGWDYRARAIYQITVTLADRASAALGRLEVRRRDDGWLSVGEAAARGLAPEEIEARIVASAYGAAVREALADMTRLYPQVEILAWQLMPDHVHFVAFVKSPLDRPFGALVRGFKAGAARRWREIDSAKNGRAQNAAKNGRAQNAAKNGRAQNAAKNGRAQNAPENGACSVLARSRASSVLARSRASSVLARSRASLPAWSEGFQDTVLLHEGQLANMTRYLADNPRRLALKRLFPDLFRVVRELRLPLVWGERRLVGRFMALGNRFLLGRPLAQVQVSRSDFGWRRVPCSPVVGRAGGSSPVVGRARGGGLKIVRDANGEPVVDFATPLYAEKKAALFAAAKHGAVLVSPCVSDGERQIAREALKAGLDLVAMKNKGFSPLQKPTGRLFDACVEGRLLLLAPAGWPYQPGEKVMTRFDATAMNRLCQGLVGEDAADINYHGMRPANIDALAIAAARAE